MIHAPTWREKNLHASMFIATNTFKRQDRLVDLRGLSCLRILRGWRARRELVGLGSLSCLSCSRGWVSRETVCHAQAGPKSSTKIVPSIGTKSETISENSWEA